MNSRDNTQSSLGTQGINRVRHSHTEETDRQQTGVTAPWEQGRWGKAAEERYCWNEVFSQVMDWFHYAGGPGVSCHSAILSIWHWASLCFSDLASLCRTRHEKLQSASQSPLPVFMNKILLESCPRYPFTHTPSRAAFALGWQIWVLVTWVWNGLKAENLDLYRKCMQTTGFRQNQHKYFSKPRILQFCKFH